MPISSQVNNAYVPRFYPELDENGVCETPRTVTDVTVNPQQLVAVPTKSGVSIGKVLLIGAVVLGVCIAVTLVITLSILLTRTTTTNATTVTTSTTTSATTTTTTSPPAAPANMMGFRGNINQNYTFTATGSTSGSVWGTVIYTDDSNLATAAVHAGVLTVGQTGTIIVMVLAGQSSYAGSVQNGITAWSYGNWPGSYRFVIASG